ncbi:MAG: hypothetical protein JXA43_02595, partial [Candidatus Diapherotrites archaeon]|nr:hypothetical protein [Candidatus Diapherotrites archaeon]
PSLDNELIHKIILLMETELKQGISKNHASENISVDLMNEGLLIHKTTIFNLFSPGTDTYKSLSKDCPDLKKTIDDINLKYGQH